MVCAHQKRYLVETLLTVPCLALKSVKRDHRVADPPADYTQTSLHPSIFFPSHVSQDNVECHPKAVIHGSITNCALRKIIAIWTLELRF